MERIVFKSEYLNIIFGSLLLIFAVVGYFTSFIEEFIPIIIGVILVLLSTKRFVYTFRKITSKNATFILVVEILLDYLFAGLLIYLQDHVELFVGLIIYTRGVSYLIINYVATRKIKIVQYLFNIGYVTFGSFLIFTSYSSVVFLSIAIVSLTVIIGGIYLQFGVRKIVTKEKLNELKMEENKNRDKLQKIEAKSEKKIEQLNTEIKKVTQEQKKVSSENKELEKIVKKLEPKSEIKEPMKSKQVIEAKVNYEELTLVELRLIAKEKNITGVSQLKKADLIKKLSE